MTEGACSNTTNGLISGCVSTCISSGLVARDGGASCRAPPAVVPTTQTYGRRHCSGRDGCCHAPISEGRTPKRVKFKGLNQTNTSADGFSRAFAFISAEGLSDQWYMILSRTVLSSLDLSMHMPSPIVLRWAVKQGLLPPAAQKSSWQCPQLGVTSRQENGEAIRATPLPATSATLTSPTGAKVLILTQYSFSFIFIICHAFTRKGMFIWGSTIYSIVTAHYYAKWLATDSCNVMAVSLALGIPCFGYCNPKPGQQQPPFECVCPRGTHGNPYKPHGCVSSSTTTGDSHY